MVVIDNRILTEMNELDKPPLKRIMLIDSADVFFSLFFQTRREYLEDQRRKRDLKGSKIDMKIYMNDQYEWDKNWEFLRKLQINAEKCFKDLVRFHNITEYENVFFIRDSSRDSNWRKKIFSSYKSNRKNVINHCGGQVNVSTIFNFIYSDTIPLLNRKYNFHLVKVNNAEADDVIGVLANHYASEFEIVVISSDTDYLQLLVHKNISIYNARNQNMEYKLIQNTEHTSSQMMYKIRNEKLDINERIYLAMMFLFKKIIKGDKSDNISPCFRKKREVNYYLSDFAKLHEKIKTDEAIFEKFRRNSYLIDFVYVPDDIQNKILETFKPYFSKI